MKKIALLSLSVFLLNTVSSQNIVAKIQERDYYPQQDEGGVEFFREQSTPGEDKLIIAYQSKYNDTVYVYWVYNWELSVTNKNISFSCNFVDFNYAYEKKKGQIKRYQDRGGKDGAGMFVGTYEVNKNETLYLRESDTLWKGSFNNLTSEVIIKKGNKIHVFNLM